MTEQKAVRASIKHWKEMIQWVEKLNPFDKRDRYVMERAINSTWFDEDCDLCLKFSARSCPDCPLQKKYGKCGYEEVENPWDSINTSLNWGDWLVGGREMLIQLESLIQPTKADALQASYDEAGVAFDALYLLRQSLLSQLNQAQQEEEREENE